MFTLELTPRKRFPGFVGSAGVHCAAALVMFLMPAGPGPKPESAPVHRYSVRILHLLDPRVASAQGQRASKAGMLQRASAQLPLSAAGPSQPGAAGARAFKLPPLSPQLVRKSASQTLLQPDLPPNMSLQKDLPVPALAIFNQPQAPDRRFVAPALRLQQAGKTRLISLAPAPSLKTPTREPMAAPPLLLGGPDLSRAPQMLAAPQTSEPVLAPNVLSVPATPVRSQDLVILPPVNEIAGGTGDGAQGVRSPADAGASPAGAGSASGTGADGTSGLAEGKGASGGGSLVAGAAGAGGAGANGAGGAGSNNAGGAGANGTGGTGSNGTEGAGPSEGSGEGHSGVGADGSGNAAINLALSSPEVHKFTLPKEGKYGVVIMGSEAAAPYPESVGALTGRLIYTVYLKAGTRKNWILQYCLPPGVEAKGRVTSSATPLEAPYPYTLYRLDAFDGEDIDYVLVRGRVTAEGKFDGLNLVFPVELKRRDLLLNSLRGWEFRPARRDGQNAEVEVLLIIPRES